MFLRSSFLLCSLSYVLIDGANLSQTLLTQTLCSDCCKTNLCDEDSHQIEYKIPVSTCYNPQVEFPDDNGDVWGATDVYDECNDRYLKRTFYSSSDGTCTNATDTYTLVYDTCLGPFGEEYPWGVFSCS
mmetsp:Transcript_2737/g.5630  ORF Transcript_2737/g.5630 Transcript_2737/m.5630 type:complete len:129 (-) Transcript_2737:29-415(-)